MEEDRREFVAQMCRRLFDERLAGSRLEKWLNRQPGGWGENPGLDRLSACLRHLEKYLGGDVLYTPYSWVPRMVWVLLDKKQQMGLRILYPSGQLKIDPYNEWGA